jgi:tRNA 2-thiouridine synthesizing protein A
MSDQNTTNIIDAMGQPCPMPLLLLKRALKKLSKFSIKIV